MRAAVASNESCQRGSTALMVTAKEIYFTVPPLVGATQILRFLVLVPVAVEISLLAKSQSLNVEWKHCTPGRPPLKSGRKHSGSVSVSQAEQHDILE